MPRTKKAIRLEVPQTLDETRTRPLFVAAIMLTDQERRAHIWEMRLRGYSYEAISREMVRQFGPDALPDNWGPKYVYSDCAAVLAQINNEYKETAAEMVDIELNRFDQLLAAVWDNAVAGDTAAITKALEISRERRKMMGLDNPERIEVSWKIQVADLMRKGLITPQDVVREFGEEGLITVNQYLLEMKET